MHDRQSLFDDDEDDFDDEFKGEVDPLIEEELEEEEEDLVTATDENADSKSNSSKTNQTEYEDLPPMPPW